MLAKLAEFRLVAEFELRQAISKLAKLAKSILNEAML